MYKIEQRKLTKEFWRQHPNYLEIRFAIAGALKNYSLTM
jgi:hypothetical protein